MIDLATLSFKVVTTDLDTAATKILALSTAIQDLNAKQKSLTESSKDEATATKAKIKSDNEMLKLKESLAKAEADLAAKTAVGAAGTNTSNRETDKMLALFSRLDNLYMDLAKGSSSWESSILQQARSLKASAEQIELVKTKLSEVAGLKKDPFDSTIGSIRSIEAALKSLTERSALAASGTYLNTKQLEEYSRISREIKGQMRSEGKNPETAGLEEFNKRLKEQQEKYKQIAGELNAKTALERKSNEELNEQLKITAGIEQANKRIEDTIKQTADITQRMKSGFTQEQASKLNEAERLGINIGLVYKLTEAEKLLNAEKDKQANSAKIQASIEAERKAMEDLNSGILKNISDRTKLQALEDKYKQQGFNITNSKELANTELKGASTSTIDSLKVYVKGIQDAESANNLLTAANQRAREQSEQAAAQLIKVQRDQKSAVDSNADSITRLNAIQAQMRSGSSYESAVRLVDGAKIGLSIAQIQALMKAEKDLNIERKNQTDAQNVINKVAEERNALNELNNSMQANIAARTRMDSLVAKYTTMKFDSNFAKELANLEFKGASQSSIDQLKNYALGVQADKKAVEALTEAERALESVQKSIARDTAAQRYITAGASSTVARAAAGQEVAGVPQSVIDSYIRVATAKEKATKADRELVAADKYILDIEAKLAAAMQVGNQNLDRRSTDELVKYKASLLLVGTAADVVASKMQKMKEQMDTVANQQRERQLTHLSRAISTQMGDVGVSLFSGQNPLTVMIQQGDQIRYALMQAGAKGKELQTAMQNAAAQIASSFVLTFKAMGSFVTGTFSSIGNAFKGAFDAGAIRAAAAEDITQKLQAGSITYLRSLRLMEVANINFQQSLMGVKIMAGLVAVAIAATLAVAFYKVMKEQDDMVATLSTMGASMGLTAASAEQYARSMNNIGISTGNGLKVIAEMAKSNEFLSSDIEMVTKAAVDMERYGGVAIADTVKQFEKLKKDPVNTLLELNRAMGTIPPAAINAVMELDKMGDHAGATEKAMKLLSAATTNSVDQMKGDFTNFAMFMKETGEFMSKEYDKFVKELLRKASPSDMVEKELLKIDQKIAFQNSNHTGALFKLYDIDDLQRQRKLLLDQLDKYGVEDKKVVDSKEKVSRIEKRTEKLKAEEYTFSRPSEKLSKNLKQNATDLADALKDNDQGNVDRAVRIIQEQSKKISEALATEYKKDNPKEKKGPRSSFSSPITNTSNIEKEYTSALALDEKYGKDKREILKLKFEAEMITRGYYVAEDIKLVVEGEKKKLEDIKKYSKLVKEEYEKNTSDVSARQAKALGETKDPKSRENIMESSTAAQTKLNEAYKTFNKLQEDKIAGVALDFEKRKIETIKEQNSFMKEATTEYKNLNKEMLNNHEASKLDMEMKKGLIGLSDPEVAGYQAKTKAMQQYQKVMNSMDTTIANALKFYNELKASLGSDPESKSVLDNAWENIQKLKEDRIKAGIDSKTAAEIASVDAVNKYWLDESLKVQDGIAGSITDAIMSGGQAGSKAIKSVLDNLLKDMLNNIFKKLLGSFSDAIMNAIMGASGGSSNSGGGLVESIVRMGVSYFAGNAAGSVGGSSNLYGLGSGGDATSGFKLSGRAVGGFVNEGSSYMVGENGPEKFVPNQAGSIIPAHKANAENTKPLSVTIINNTSAQIGRVTERQISPTERALVIEDAITAVAAQAHDPNSRVSKSFQNNFKLQRNR